MKPSTSRVELRPYQLEAIQRLRQQYAAGRTRPVLVMPTGSGKTRVAASIIQSALAKQKRVVFAAGRVELLNQTLEKLAEAGVTDCRLIQADNLSGSDSSPVIVASVPTLASKLWRDRLPPADFLVLDECHHGPAASYARVAAAYPMALGLTATPIRSDQRGLGDVFDSLVVGSTVQDLQTLGFLVPCRVFSAPETTASRTLSLSPVEAYERHADGQRAFVFCTTVSHAETVAAEFAYAGITATVVHGKLPDAERAKRLDDFRAGRVRVLANVGICVEGYDDPAAAVAILARRFGHAGTFLQVVGRVLRPAPGKLSATVVDLCGSVLEHGTPDADRTYSLDGRGISKADRQSIRQCLACGGVFVAGPAACPMCAAALPRLNRRTPSSNDAGVVEVAPKTPARPWFVRMRSKRPGRCKGCSQLIPVGSQIIWAKGQPTYHDDCAPNGALVRRFSRAA